MKMFLVSISRHKTLFISMFKKMNFLNMEINEFSFNEFFDFWIPLNVAKYVAPVHAHHRPQTPIFSHKSNFETVE